MQKLCGLSTSKILPIFTSDGYFDYPFRVSLENEFGVLESIQLRWVMTKRYHKCHNWSMAVLFNNRRIDGIDHEKRVSDHRGHICSGWHRHMWDIGAVDCERKKECLDGFGPFEDFKEFVVAGCTLLHIQLDDEEEANETGYLSFD